ncbi:hypothetical protein E0Z10_g1809 [Xylaria hypoxylon]|uniref:Uncharacterized protein n=1 Tax=Xylaria hypoxylon TaxID=37992 RepID=A0A4Z0Z3Z4_9PEZI|nr:hypothetical protein E0Z10_g1809 [Xylaria hypoxylon]
MIPGLTLNTEAAASRASQQQQPPAGRTSALAPNSSNPPARPFQSTTPIPVPSYASREQPQASPRSSSPVRPTYSPITPPLNATAFPPQPTYTHSSHVDATAAPAPPPEAIDFDSNPDVLALKSAISILQMQRRKTERDMATLDRVKRTALAEPEAFIRDLTAGRVRVEGEGLFVDSVKDEDSDSDSSSEGETPSHNYEETKYIQPQSATEEKPNINTNSEAATPGPPPWASIPKPQNIVRCPPINWSQYAVVGASLDKLHNEQVQRPAQGTPAALTPEGRFEFKGGDGGGVGKQERYVGVAAPYAPGKDKIDGKSKTTPKR